jgi:hypothetical protein
MTDFGVGKRSEAVVGPVGCLRFVRATYKEETIKMEKRAKLFGEGRDRSALITQRR